MPKIVNLPLITALTLAASAVFPISQSGTTYKETLGDMRTVLMAGGGAFAATDDLSIRGITTTGALAVGTTANIVGNFSVATNKFTVAASSGNTVVAGTLGVTGLVSINGGLNANSVINLTGTSSTVTVGTQAADRYDLSRTGSFPSLDYSNAGVTFRFLTTAAAPASVSMGALTATTGTFSGLVTASTANGVTTILRLAQTGAATWNITNNATDGKLVINDSGSTWLIITPTTGFTQLLGATDIGGNFSVASSKFTVAASTGNTVIGGSTLKLTDGNLWFGTAGDGWLSPDGSQSASVTNTSITFTDATSFTSSASALNFQLSANGGALGAGVRYIDGGGTASYWQYNAPTAGGHAFSRQGSNVFVVDSSGLTVSDNISISKTGNGISTAMAAGTSVWQTNDGTGSSFFGVAGGLVVMGATNAAYNTAIYAGNVLATSFNKTTQTATFSSSIVLGTNNTAIQATTTGASVVNIFKLTNDATSITRFLCGVDAGGFQWTNQGASSQWMGLSAAGLTISDPGVLAVQHGTGSIVMGGSRTGANYRTDIQFLVTDGASANQVWNVGSNMNTVGGRFEIVGAGTTWMNITLAGMATLAGGSSTTAGLVMNAGLIQYFGNTTGAGTPLLSTNCPAVTVTAPYTWIKAMAADGSIIYSPAWK